MSIRTSNDRFPLSTNAHTSTTAVEHIILVRLLDISERPVLVLLRLGLGIVVVLIDVLLSWFFLWNVLLRHVVFLILIRHRFYRHDSWGHERLKASDKGAELVFFVEMNGVGFVMLFAAQAFELTNTNTHKTQSLALVSARLTGENLQNVTQNTY